MTFIKEHMKNQKMKFGIDIKEKRDEQNIKDSTIDIISRF